MTTFIKAGLWTKKKEGYKGELNLDQFVASKTPTASYKVYTALLTQSGGDNFINNSTDSTELFIIGVTYYIDENNSPTADFTNIGAPNNQVGTYFVATGTTPNSWGNGEYVNLRYNQGAPVVTVLENTIGNVWLSYDSVGTHRLELPIGTVDNTFCISTNNDVSQNYSIGFFVIGSFINSRVSINNWDLIGNAIDGYNQSIEIRVYN